MLKYKTQKINVFENKTPKWNERKLFKILKFKMFKHMF